MRGRSITILCLLLLSGQAMAKGRWFPLKPKDSKSHIATVSAGNPNWTRMGELPGAEIVYGLLQTKDGTIYAATACADKGRVFKSTDNCETWDTTSTLPEDTSYAVLSLFQAKDGVLYVSTVNDVGRIFKSTDGGNTWVETGSLGDAMWAYPITQTSDGSLYTGSGSSDDRALVLKSEDNGNTWIPTGDIEEGNGVLAFIQSSDGVLYAGVSIIPWVEGYKEKAWVYKSADGGNTWTKAGSLERAVFIYSLLESKDGTLYASAACWEPAGLDTLEVGKVFKSVDKGETWKETAPISEAYMWWWPLIEDFNGTIYVGGTISYSMEETYAKVFKTTDKGETWIDTGTLEGADIVFSLLQTSDGSIYAGTGEYDGYILKYTPTGVKEESVSSIPQTLTISPNPFNQGTRIKFQGISEEINLSIYDATGILVRGWHRAKGIGHRGYSLTWDGRDEKGIEVPPGVYFIQAKTPIGVEIEKILKIR